MNSILALRQTRKNILAVIDGLSLEEMNTVPAGFNNSILWNLGHLLITQQSINYRLSGLPMYFDTDLVDVFKKGSTCQVYSEDTLNTIESNFLSIIDVLEKDIEEGKFKSFQEYPTSYGVVLKTFEDSLSFNAVHEALHLGYIMAQKRALRA